MKIEIYAKERHFADHLRPVVDRLEEAGLEVEWIGAGKKAQGESLFAMVSSWGDLVRATEARRLVFYFEHGAGQIYSSTRNASYAGGIGRDNVCAFISPGPHVDLINRKFYPKIPSISAGVPKLDQFHAEMTQEPEDPKLEPVVCFSFHWDCQICEETKSGFEHFKYSILDAKRELKDTAKIVVHCHPRAVKMCLPFFQENDLEYIEDFEDVLRTADVYICDNSSTIFEFASIGKPVILLNPPHYRKHQHHGLRFWSHADIGDQVHNVQELLVAIKRSLVDTREKKAHRLNRVKTIYHATDGRASERAALGIMKFMEEFYRMQEEGCEVLVKRFTTGIFGWVDPGSKVTVFDEHAVVKCPLGRFLRKVDFPYSMKPKARLKRLLQKSNVYELAESLKDEFDSEIDPLDMDFSANITDRDEFKPQDKRLSAEEMHIIQAISEGKTKTQAVYHDRGDFKTPALQRAWDRLETDGFIEEDTENKFKWKVKTWGL